MAETNDLHTWEHELDDLDPSELSYVFQLARYEYNRFESAAGFSVEEIDIAEDGFNHDVFEVFDEDNEHLINILKQVLNTVLDEECTALQKDGADIARLSRINAVTSLINMAEHDQACGYSVVKLLVCILAKLIKTDA